MRERDQGRGYGLPENVCAVIGAVGAVLVIISSGVPDAIRLIPVAAGTSVLGAAFFIRRRVDSIQNNK